MLSFTHQRSSPVTISQVLVTSSLPLTIRGTGQASEGRAEGDMISTAEI